MPVPTYSPHNFHSHSNKTTSFEDLERKHIEEILPDVKYNKSHAAKTLGIARKTLREKNQKY